MMLKVLRLHDTLQDDYGEMDTYVRLGLGLASNYQLLTDCATTSPLVRLVEYKLSSFFHFGTDVFMCFLCLLFVYFCVNITMMVMAMLMEMAGMVMCTKFFH